MKSVMTSKQTKEKVEKDRRDLLASNNAKRNPWDNVEERENEITLNQYKSSQQQMHREQDEVLDDMLGSLKRLGVMGDVIEKELDEHNDLLDDVEEDLDHAQDRLQ